MFGGIGAYLHLDDPDSVAGSVTNFDVGETIDLQGIDPSSVRLRIRQIDVQVAASRHSAGARQRRDGVRPPARTAPRSPCCASAPARRS